MKNWRVRVPIGGGILLAAYALTRCDAGFAVPRIGPVVASLLGLGALVESLRMFGPAVRGAPFRAAVAAGFAVVVAAAVRPAGESALPREPAFALAASWAAVVGALAARVAARRRVDVVVDDLRGVALAAAALAVTVVPSAALGALATDVRGPVGGPWLLLAVVLVAKANDIGGYVVGSLVGGRKLCPGVSPGKTVSGAWGGLAFGVGAAFAAFAALPFPPTASFDPARVVAFSLLVSVAAQAGDLCESLVKRAAGVKDSGALLPAFGGLFDLVDSFILAAPVAYAAASAGLL